MTHISQASFQDESNTVLLGEGSLVPPKLGRL